MVHDRCQARPPGITGRMDFDIHRIAPDEWTAAGAVIVEAYRPFLRGPDDPYMSRLRDVASRDRDAEVFVAVDDRQVLGCVTSCPPGSAWRELAQADEGEFRMLAVTPSAQGHGVGHALVAHCEDRAEAAGFTAMVISSLPAMTGAHRLYERLGYVREATRDWRPLPEVSLIAYAKQLPE